MIALDQPGRAWRVVEGGVRVFAEPVGGGQRRFLFRVEAGDRVFGAAPAGGWRLWGLAEVGRVEEVEATGGEAFWAAVAAATGADAAADDLGPAMARALDARVAAEEVERVRARAARAAAADLDQEGVARRISAIVGDAAAPVGDPKDRLFAAAAVAAGAAGFTVVAPSLPGAHVLRLSRLARASRCRVRRVDLEGPWWSEGGPPLVAFVGELPVALVPEARGGYALVDPVTGARTRLGARAAAEVAPVAWELVRPLPERAQGLLDLLSFARVGLGVEAARAAVWAAALTAVGMLLPAATGLLIDQAVPDADRSMIVALGVGLLAVSLSSAAFRWAEQLALLRLDTRAASAAQMALWDRLLRLPLSALRAWSLGDLMSRAGAVTTVSQRLTGVTLQSLLGGGLGLANFLLLLAYSPTLAAVAAVAGAGMVALTVSSAVVSGRQSRALVQQRARVFGATVQVVGGVAKIQAAGVRGAALAWWSRLYVSQLEHQWATWVTRDRVAALQTALPAATSAVMFLVAARLHREGALTAGTFVAFNATFAMFMGALGSVAGAAASLASARAEAERAAPLLAASPEVKHASVDPGVLAGGLAFERLRFRYRADGPYVVDGVSLAIRPGEFVALVGASGCGKSTLLRLLLGFETAESGRILFDGQDLSGLDVEAVRRQLGIVLQGGRVGGGSILEVVAGASAVSVDEVWRALEAASLRAEVEAMPMGLHTRVGDGGGNLSGGQRQRLLIARAMVGRPKLLIFDEATSALDNRAQAEISENLAKLSVTRIVVAHRLSTIQGADRIVVLADGRVQQSGTFAELAEVDGPFRRLVARQRAG